MTREEALARLHEITRGIDREELEDDSGWWETSTGAEFGAATLRELEDLIRTLV